MAGRHPLSLTLHHSHLHQCNPHSWSGRRALRGQRLHRCCARVGIRVVRVLLLSACVGQCCCVRVCECQYGCVPSCPPLQEQPQPSISFLFASMSLSQFIATPSPSLSSPLCHFSSLSLSLALARCPLLRSTASLGPPLNSEINERQKEKERPGRRVGSSIGICRPSTVTISSSSSFYLYSLSLPLHLFASYSDL